MHALSLDDIKSVIFYVSTVYNASSLSNQLAAIETLTGNNYVRWKRDVEIALGLLGLNFAMENKLEKPTNKSTVEYVAEHEKWERANKLCLKIIKRSISDSILGAIPNNENVKSFMDAIGENLLSLIKPKLRI